MQVTWAVSEEPANFLKVFILPSEMSQYNFPNNVQTDSDYTLVTRFNVWSTSIRSCLTHFNRLAFSEIQQLVESSGISLAISDIQNIHRGGVSLQGWMCANVKSCA